MSSKAMRGLSDPVSGQATVEIPLTQGKVAIIDAEDFPLVRARLWHAALDWGTVWYARNGNGEKMTTMHWVIMGRKRVDHKDGNGLNNRRGNLRPATPAQNSANQKRNSLNTSGFKGVYLRKDRSRWMACVWKSGKRAFIKGFSTPLEAAKGYDEAALRIFGEFARTNFKKEN